MKLIPRGGDIGLLIRVMLLASSYWPLIVLFFIVSMLATPLTLLSPIPLKIVADALVHKEALPAFLSPLVPDAFESSETRLILLAALLFVFTALLRQTQDLARTLLYTYIGERLTLKFRSQLFAQVQRISLAYHDRQGTADSVYRIQYDATAIQDLAIDGLIPFLSSSFTLIAMVYVILALDWQLGVAALAAGPVLLVLTRMYQMRLRQRARTVKRLESSAMGVIQEVLGALRVVKAFGQEEREGERFYGRAEDGVQARVGLSVLEGLFGLLIGATTAGGGAIVLYIGALHVQSGVLTPGELLLVMGYLSQFYDPLRNASKRVGKMQSSFASAERAFAILDHQPDVQDRSDACGLTRATGRITFDNVSFGYIDGYPVIKNASFDALPGARVGIAGATGAGKTTLISLLMRFYDPNTGRILLDGRCLSEYRVADLRNQFAVVLQDTVLFSGTIAENIAYSKPSASRSEIIAAAQSACGHEFILTLPEGYETIVGERGMRLSGGERQRVGLARAFLKDAPVLILDEPTSAVDSVTERSIMEATQKLMEGRTTFIISHRLNTLSDCDLRIGIEAGHIDIGRDNGKRRNGNVKTTPSRSAVAEHPAAVSWLLLARGRTPDEMETIKEEKRSSVLRLKHAGPQSEHVIAKREARRDLLVERTIYEHVLPFLTLPTPQYYGCVEEPAENHGWIFLEDAGDAICSRSPETSTLAAQWVAGLHTGATESAAGLGLPSRAASHYLQQSQSARDRIVECRDNPSLTKADVSVLEDISMLCTSIEDRWVEIERLCEGVPQTVVHGDFNHKNIRLRQREAGSELVAFDWEHAGYGTPAADLAWVDPIAYHLDVSSVWRNLSLLDVHRLVRAARILRLIDYIAWEARWLAYESLENPMANMRLYRRRLEEATRALNWWV